MIQKALVGPSEEGWNIVKIIFPDIGEFLLSTRNDLDAFIKRLKKSFGNYDLEQESELGEVREENFEFQLDPKEEHISVETDIEITSAENSQKVIDHAIDNDDNFFYDLDGNKILRA